MPITLDFETRSKVDLKKVGAYKYAAHPSTEILCLAWRQDRGETHKWKAEDGKLKLMPLIWKLKEGEEIHAHNAEFEYLIWNVTGRRNNEFPKIPLNKFVCDAANAASLALPRSLEKLAAAIEAPVQKDMEGNKLMRKMTRPRKPTKKDPSIWFDPPGGRVRLATYCGLDVETEDACADMLPPPPHASIDLWRLTTKINERGIFCDLPLVIRAKTWANQYERELLAELAELTDGEVRTAKQTAKLKSWLEGEGCKVISVAKDHVTAALARKDLTPKAKRALEIRRALAKSSVTKLVAMENMAMGDGRIRGTLLYHGASTGRYSGRGIQPQNYPRGTVKDVENIFEALELGSYEFFKALFPDVFSAISSALRGMLRASPGCRLLGADYNAIEARVVMWVSGCQDGVDLFLKDTGVYEDMARIVYGLPKNAPVTEDQRQLGKQVILGCGFGMGWRKFMITCQGYGMKVDKKLAMKAVQAYREMFGEVVDFWRNINQACITAVKTKKRVTLGKLQFLVKGKFLFIRLPSGRRLAYYDPQIRWIKKDWGMTETLTYMAVHPKTKAWYREETYGGKLTENVVQGIAADVMTDAMIRLEEHNYPIVLSVHDELVGDVPNDFGSLKEFENLMATLEPWAEGLPVKVKGWERQRFKK